MESQSRTYRNAAEIELSRHRINISKKPADTDSTTITTREDAYPYPGEQYILSVDRYQIEVMDHLDELPATGAVIFCTFPKVRDGVGYPARVFAVCPAS